jgi:hypothetical protein
MLIQSWVRPPLDSKLRGSFLIRIEAPGTTSSLSFFKNFQGLTNGQTNLTQNKLDSMESMVIKTILLSQFSTLVFCSPLVRLRSKRYLLL